MLAQLDAASVVLTAVKITLVTGFAALYRVLDDKHTASYTKVKQNVLIIKKTLWGGGNPKLCEL